jgi:hypothetical protein
MSLTSHVFRVPRRAVGDCSSQDVALAGDPLQLGLQLADLGALGCGRRLAGLRVEGLANPVRVAGRCESSRCSVRPQRDARNRDARSDRPPTRQQHPRQQRGNKPPSPVNAIPSARAASTSRAAIRSSPPPSTSSTGTNAFDVGPSVRLNVSLSDPQASAADHRATPTYTKRLTDPTAGVGSVRQTRPGSCGTLCSRDVDRAGGIRRPSVNRVGVVDVRQLRRTFSTRALDPADARSQVAIGRTGQLETITVS